MVKANMDYWEPNVTFKSAACGVIKATQDYEEDTTYDIATISNALKGVGIDTDNLLCHAVSPQKPNKS